MARKSNSTALTYLQRVRDLYKQPAGHVDRKRKYADAFSNPEMTLTPTSTLMRTNNNNGCTVPFSGMFTHHMNYGTSSGHETLVAYSPSMGSDIIGK